MLTPKDIYEKEFKRALRGYDENEVNEFLDQIINDYSKILEENKELKEEIAKFRKETGSEKRSEAGNKELSTLTDREIISDLVRRVEALEKKTKYF